MWKVEIPTVDLPGGYELFEDEDFVCLRYGDKVVAGFRSNTVDPAEIVKAARQHQQACR